MAAHNLRESLRDVASFSQLLAETYAGRLDSDADAFLERIQEGAARMQSLLADVVDYWATGAGDRQSSRTDMEAVLRQALLCDGQADSRTGAVVTHDPLPPVCGDFEILTKVLHHLIQKCHRILRHDLLPRVHISSKRVDLEWVFSVAGQRPWHRSGIPGPHLRACSSACTGKKPRERTGTRILQEGDRVAWRSNVDGIDTRGGIDILFHSAACRLKRNPSVTPRRDPAPRNSCLSGGQKLHLRAGGWSFALVFTGIAVWFQICSSPDAGSRKEVTGSLILEPPHERRFQGVTVSGLVVVQFLIRKRRNHATNERRQRAVDAESSGGGHPYR